MDLILNKPAKDYLMSKFYAGEIVKQIDPSNEKTEVHVDLSLTRLKPLGAKWFIQLYDYRKANSQIIKMGLKRQESYFKLLNENVYL